MRRSASRKRATGMHMTQVTKYDDQILICDPARPPHEFEPGLMRMATRRVRRCTCSWLATTSIEVAYDQSANVRHRLAHGHSHSMSKYQAQ